MRLRAQLANQRWTWLRKYLFRPPSITIKSNKAAVWVMIIRGYDEPLSSGCILLPDGEAATRLPRIHPRAAYCPLMFISPFSGNAGDKPGNTKNNPWCFIRTQYPGNPADVSYQCPVCTLHIRTSHPLKHRIEESSMTMPSKPEMSSVLYLINLATPNPYVASSDSPEDPPSSNNSGFFSITSCLFAQEDCHPSNTILASALDTIYYLPLIELSFGLKRVPGLAGLAICDRDGGSAHSEQQRTSLHTHTTKLDTWMPSFRPMFSCYFYPLDVKWLAGYVVLQVRLPVNLISVCPPY
ncbi:uncharacterized protein B0T23DRAFT_76756 [Neurospora hispaniola]|uniref:Uncharacterized protein n=1 Tax=Neurospora hispaniola TaxID=588809 RepID=A0AAJ0ICG3_9PEZI|nr:hypothetical protein B0T23DRAFT_76756 [Neurospora hispaniola]